MNTVRTGPHQRLPPANHLWRSQWPRNLLAPRPDCPSVDAWTRAPAQRDAKRMSASDRRNGSRQGNAALHLRADQGFSVEAISRHADLRGPHRAARLIVADFRESVKFPSSKTLRHLTRDRSRGPVGRARRAPGGDQRAGGRPESAALPREGGRGEGRCDGTDTKMRGRAQRRTGALGSVPAIPRCPWVGTAHSSCRGMVSRATTTLRRLLSAADSTRSRWLWSARCQKCLGSMTGMSKTTLLVGPGFRLRT